LISYPFALAASLIEDERERDHFIRRAARNVANPYHVLRKFNDPEAPERARKR
jgi:hypothetical protein